MDVSRTGTWMLLLALLGACGLQDPSVEQRLGGVLESGSCSAANPQGCRSDADCTLGQHCEATPDACHPGSCACDERTQLWACTRDCVFAACVPGRPDAGSEPPPLLPCEGPNPGGCASDAACPAGQVCVDDPDTCVSTGCQCDTSVGAWVCTPDCNGRVCKPAP